MYLLLKLQVIKYIQISTDKLIVKKSTLNIYYTNSLTICSAIAMDAVAPGDGALRT